MSRVAKSPLAITTGIDVDVAGDKIKIKGAKGALEYRPPLGVKITKEEGKAIRFIPQLELPNADALAGTTRALIRNMLVGVANGYEKKLTLVGVGYRAQLQGKILNLQLGYSHPIKYTIPAGIVIEVPSQTEIAVKGMDKQLVGQVAAQIRAFRPPEPYKGKGVRYANEVIQQKEGKKK